MKKRRGVKVISKRVTLGITVPDWLKKTLFDLVYKNKTPIAYSVSELIEEILLLYLSEYVEIKKTTMKQPNGYRNFQSLLKLSEYSIKSNFEYIIKTKVPIKVEE